MRCVRDGHVVVLPGGLRVAALWGIDRDAPNARRGEIERAYLKPRSADDAAILAKTKFPGKPPLWIPMPPH